MIRSVLINIPNNSTPSNTYNRLYAIDDVLYWAGTTLITATVASNYFIQNGNSFGTTAVLGTNDNQNLQLKTNNITRLTIGTSGYVYIGMTATPYSIKVYGGVYNTLLGTGENTSNVVNIRSANTSNMAAMSYFYTNTDITPDFFGKFGYKFESAVTNPARQFQIYVSDSATPKFIVNGAGSVGIGTINPTASLHVVGDGYITNNLIVGNLTVVGTTSTINSTNLSIKDAIIELNIGQVGANPLYDSGFIINRGLGGSGSGANVGFIWNESTDRFLLLGTNLTASATTVTYSNFEDLQYRNSFIQYQQIIASSSATGSVAFNIRNNVGSNIFNVNHNGDVRVGIVNYNQNDGIFSIYGDGTHPSNVIFSVRSATNGLGLYVTNLGHVNIGGNQILYHSNYYQYGSGSDYTLRARTNGALTLASNDITRLTIGSSGTFTFNSLTGTQSDLVFIDLNGVIGRTSSSTFLSGNYFAQNGNSFGTTAVLGTNDNQPLHLETNGVTRLIIGTNSNISIGSILDSTSQLYVNSMFGGWNNSAMKIWYSSTDTVLGEVSALAHRNGNWTSLYVNGTGSSLTHTIYTEGNKPIIFNSGNIGVNIGATSPTASLLIYGNNSQSILNLQNLTSGSNIDFGSASGTITIDNNTSGATTFIARRKTAPTTRFISMDTNGRLIIKSFHTEGLPSTNSALEVYHFGAVNSASHKYTSIINSNITSTGTAATGDFSVLHFTGTYNQLSGAAHQIHGIFYNPTIGSVSGTHYFLRSTSGDILATGGRYYFYGTDTNASSVFNIYAGAALSGNSNVGILNVVNQSVANANNIILSNWSSHSSNNYTGIAFVNRQLDTSALPSARIRSRYYDSNNNGELEFYTALTGSDTYVGAFKDKRFYIGNSTNSSQINATLNVISYTTASNSYLATFRNSLLDNILVITDDGKLGIKTTTLTSTLNVSGDIRVFNSATFAAIKTGAYATSPLPLEMSPNTIVGNADSVNTVISPTISDYGQLGVYGIGGGQSGGRWNIGVMGYQKFNQNFNGNSNNTGIGGYFLAKGIGNVTDFNGSYIGIHAEGNIGADTSGTYSGGNIYGVKAYAYGNGTTTTYGLYTLATNGANNYAIYSAAGYNYLSDITGVGTISASYRLAVLNNISLRSTTVAEFDFYNTNSNIGRISLGTASFNITSLNNSTPIVFTNQNGEIARFNSNRNLLIGTTSNLGSRLIVDGNITSISEIQAYNPNGISRIYTGESVNSLSGNSIVMETDSASNHARLYSYGLSTALELHSIGIGSNVIMSSYNNILLQTNNNGGFGGTSRMTILATSGYVGIGITSPLYMLDVLSGATISARFDGRVIGVTAVNSNEFITLGQLSSAATTYFIQNGNSFGATAVLGTNDNYNLQFEVNAIPSLTIGTNGFLTIGTNSSSNFLRSNLSNNTNLTILESAFSYNAPYTTYSAISLRGTQYALTQSAVNNTFFVLQPTLISTTSSQIQTAFSVKATFTGSNTSTNIIADFSSQNGSMFSVVDGITGSIFNVNDISGIPILNATSDWDFNISDYPDYVFTKQNKNLLLGVTGSSASNVIIRSDLVLNQGLGFIYEINQSSVTTTNTTPTIMWNTTLTGTQSILIDVKINAISNNSTADCIIGEIKATYKKNSATTSVVGKPYKFLNTDNEFVDLNFGLSNSTINLNVIGATSETYNWRATITTQIF